MDVSLFLACLCSKWRGAILAAGEMRIGMICESLPTGGLAANDCTSGLNPLLAAAFVGKLTHYGNQFQQGRPGEVLRFDGLGAEIDLGRMI